MRLLGYTRISTTAQDAQLQLDARLFTGVQKRDVFAGVTSGSKTAASRPGMQRLLDYAESGDTVVVWRIDRLGRSLADVLKTVNLMREAGIGVRSISDGIDPATSTGRLMLNMLATLAEDERELIVERVNAGIAAARQFGTRFGRPLRDPALIAQKLAIVADARADGQTNGRGCDPGWVEPSNALPPPAKLKRPCVQVPRNKARGISLIEATLSFRSSVHVFDVAVTSGIEVSCTD